MADGRLRRTVNVSYAEALHCWQRRLKRAVSLDDDPFSDPVDLNVVARIAAELGATADKDWS